MNHARRKRSNIGLSSDPATERLFRTLVAGCESPAEALEVYYWSREPGLSEIMRGIAMMPEEARAAIEVFIALVHNAKSVQAQLDRSGVLTLASAEAARTAALAHEDAEDAPRLLN